MRPLVSLDISSLSYAALPPPTSSYLTFGAYYAVRRPYYDDVNYSAEFVDSLIGIYVLAIRVPNVCSR